MPVAANPQREPRARAVRWSTWLLAVMVATELLYAVDLMFHPAPSAVSEQFQNFASGSIFFGAAALCVMKVGFARRAFRVVPVRARNGAVRQRTGVLQRRTI